LCPLSQAAADGNFKGVATLLIARADLECTDANGKTPLFWACHGGDHDIVYLLLRAGAGVTAPDAVGNEAGSGSGGPHVHEIHQLLHQAGGFSDPAIVALFAALEQPFTPINSAASRAAVRSFHLSASYRPAELPCTAPVSPWCPARAAGFRPELVVGSGDGSELVVGSGDGGACTGAGAWPALAIETALAAPDSPAAAVPLPVLTFPLNAPYPFASLAVRRDERYNPSRTESPDDSQTALHLKGYAYSGS